MDELDNTDIEILRQLQADARLTTKELAARVHLSTTPVYERQRRLERLGYISRYVAIVNAEKIGRGFTVFCSVKLRRLNKEIAEDFATRMRQITEVSECYNISGSYDFLLKVNAPDMSYYRDFLLNVIGTIESVASIESTFVMNEVKTGYGVQL